MTSRQFAELAAAVALHSEELSAAGGPNVATLHHVWKRTVDCFADWREELLQAPSPSLYARVFAAELPIRVWCTAVAEGKGERDSRGSAIATKINNELLTLRCLMLQALAADVGLSRSEAAAVDRFRRRCERWCDLLLGPITVRTGTAECTFQPDRAREFGERFTADLAGKAAWQLVIAGLRMTFTEAESYRSAPQFQPTDRAAALASAIFASIPARAFKSDGLFRDPQIGRLSRIPQETAPKKPSKRQPTASSITPAVDKPQPSLGPSPQAHPPISFTRLRKGSPKQN